MNRLNNKQAPAERKPPPATALLVLLAVAGLYPVGAWSQQANGNHRIATAIFTDAKLVIDGQLDEPAWKTAAVVSDFTQKEPDEGKPFSELTEVRILFNKEFLYVGAYCHDRVPKGLIINDIHRDFEIQQQDYFALILDTFNDDRNGYWFGTTVEGNQRDVQFTDVGRIQNANWDGVWYSQGRRVEDGYTVEIAIPFNTLRFTKDKEQIWGLQLVRRMRRRDEIGFWAPIARIYTGPSGIAFAGELQGIENVEPGRNLQVKPYGLAGVKHLKSRDEGTQDDIDGGVDLKYGLTSGLTADLTLNTDFSQVEADAQQVNLTRFPLFFQEKREFFLENSGIFQFGSLQNDEALLFHSRTIGLAGGQPLPILGGARLTGRAGPYYLGMLNVQTRSEDAIPATNFTVARLRRNVFGNSDLGAMFVQRRSDLPDDHNRAYGADGNFLLFRSKLRVSGGLARTASPGRSGDDRLGKFEGELQTRLLRLESSYVDIGKNFNPAMGFVRRRGRRIVRNVVELRPRLSSSSQLGRYVRDIFLTNNSQYIVLGNGKPETKYMLHQLRFEFQNSAILGAHYETNFERLTAPFEVSQGVILPVGDYYFNERKVWYTSDRSKLFSGDIEWLWAGFYSGHRTELTLDFQVRPSYRFSTSVNYERNNIDLPQGAFTTDLVGLHVNYSFNPKMFLNAFIQYNSEADQVITNIRFRLIHRPLSDIYVVYNDAHDWISKKTDWTFTLKYTRLFNF
ncbi:MAG: carbohydrate binding family 9 domain-containing protein [Acidobacteria bacterium]|nr:carbohydrate binding family 9 domain-containing protein [Acidobacteriota bacterium]